MTIGGRSEARERALLLLYEAESRGETPSAVVSAQPVPPDPFTAELVHGAEERQPEIDAVIGRLSEGWPLERMPVIDRILLRLGVYELIATTTPAAVIFNEAVELAKRYSTDQSGRFVNGVLAAAERELRPTRNR